MVVVVEMVVEVAITVEMVAMMVEMQRALSSEVFLGVLDWLGLACIWQQTRSP